MLEGIINLLNTVFGLFNNLLPDSPFSEYIATNNQILQGISWLNWVLPIGEMLAMMAVWLGLCLFVVAIKVAIEVTGSVGGKVVG